ncbi:hypothetical protein Val02_58680 [Virgisporangium aliadipatigenens]|uniref:Uncharacterized protein n=1 Tax=Virgisporangium aliadipatigenens TaxID=741659 RepID=A0A8J3YR62_9ACTN|nr:hypothetical protein [Virgisporangium aliadipatigenens]GIJ48982.1 hypothetical protein Val02_58680 [Virgisporangium aliadipatigenens]
MIRNPELVRAVYLAALRHESPLSPVAVAEWLTDDDRRAHR